MLFISHNVASMHYDLGLSSSEVMVDKVKVITTVKGAL